MTFGTKSTIVWKENLVVNPSTMENFWKPK